MALKIVRIVIFVLFTLSTAFGQAAWTTDELEKEFKGKVFFLRDFSKSKKIRIGPDGSPLSSTRAGHWMMGLIEVEKVEVQYAEIVISGYRIGLIGDQQKKLVPLRLGDRISVHVIGDTSSRRWRNYFIADMRQLSDLVPPYFKNYVEGKFDAETKPDDAMKGENIGTESAVDIYRVGQNVTAPKPIFSPDPEYSDFAREHRIQGVSVLRLILGPDGKPSNIEVQRPTGAGLDEKAVQAVKRWRFVPAKRDGIPVAVTINVEVNFNFY
jgi:TonB family protein